MAKTHRVLVIIKVYVTREREKERETGKTTRKIMERRILCEKQREKAKT